MHRVLGTGMHVEGFGYLDIDDVRRELNLPARVTLPANTRAAVKMTGDDMSLVSGQLWRLAELPMYRVDALVRRAPALQNTADNPGPVARMHPAQAADLRLADGATVRVVMQEGEARVPLALDERVPAGCVWVPAGYPETAGLGANGAASVVQEGA